jgi:hypothetical protein
VEGLLAGASVTALAAVLDPRPLDCCVVLRGLDHSKTNGG